MSDLLAPSGKKKNAKKGIATQAKARRRAEAEERNAAYQKLPLAEKLKTAGAKVRAKLERNQDAGQ